MMKWAIITGAAGGIGRALVDTFSGDGYQVIAIDCVAQPEDLVCTHYLKIDLEKTVLDEDYAETVFDQIKDWVNTQGVHVLINNAAVQILGGVATLTRQDWQTTLNINLLAPFVWVQALLPELEKNLGCVINISSIHAKLTKKNFVAYATSKAALSGMTRSMAVDIGSRIRVNAIEPGAIETDMLRAGFIENPELCEQLKLGHPQLRIGRPEEVARLAQAIASGGINFLQGACIAIDGGMSVKISDTE